jgi:outer membrane lipoprotein SlyB
MPNTGREMQTARNGGRAAARETGLGIAQTGLDTLLNLDPLLFCQENKMKPTRTLAALALAGSALLGGCASNAGQTYPYSSENYGSQTNTGYGTIESIQVAQGQASTSGTGAVIGGLVGALAGNQVGSGSGRTAATVAGAVGGAAIGNRVEANRNAGSAQNYQINVRLDNGEYRSIVQDSIYDLRVGNRVRVVDGRVYRY